MISGGAEGVEKLRCAIDFSARKEYGGRGARNGRPWKDRRHIAEPRTVRNFRLAVFLKTNAQRNRKRRADDRDRDQAMVAHGVSRGSKRVQAEPPAKEPLHGGVIVFRA